MRDSEVIKRLKRIDRLNAAVRLLINEIEDSDHPHADDLARELGDQCLGICSAQHVGIDYLTSNRWALKEIPGGGLGGIIRKRSGE